MVHGREALRLRIPLEQRKVDDPGDHEAIRRSQARLPGERQPHCPKDLRRSSGSPAARTSRSDGLAASSGGQLPGSPSPAAFRFELTAPSALRRADTSPPAPSPFA